MADEWFEFARADHFWMQWRQHVLLRELKRANASIQNALEIGCGHGVVREMVERDLNIPVDGCDLNQHALEMAKNGKGRLLVYNIFDRDPAMLHHYDLVLLLDVIEHIDDDVAFLKASLDHLRPGGLVAINVPAHMAFYGKYDEVAGHKRRYNTADIESLFKKRTSHRSTLSRGDFRWCQFYMRGRLSFASCRANAQFGRASPNRTRSYTESFARCSGWKQACRFACQSGVPCWRWAG